MPPKLVGDAFASIQNGLLDFDGRAAPLLYCGGEHNCHTAAVFVAKLDRLFPVQLPFFELLQKALYEWARNHAPTTKTDEPLENENQQHERAERDGIHQRTAIVHHIKQVL